MSRTIEIDGSMGEGGGQVLRSALALSTITGKPFRITGVRAGRRKPGLAAQHLACVGAAGRICGARVAGAAAGSTEVSFLPGRASPGRYSFRVRTAGSAALVAQTVALPLALAGGESTVRIGGGTHVPWSPTAGFLADVWCPAVEKLGLHVSAELACAGYYPRGGGEVVLSVKPGRHGLMPLDAAHRGSLRRLDARVTISRLPEEIALRCRGRAEALLTENGLFAGWSECRPGAASPGVCLEISADFGVLSAGFVSIGEKGKPAERLAEDAVASLVSFLSSGAAVEMHLADQLVLPLSFVPGVSRLSAERITRHLVTVIDVVRLFLPEVEIAVDGEVGAPGTVQISVPV